MRTPARHCPPAASPDDQVWDARRRPASLKRPGEAADSSDGNTKGTSAVTQNVVYSYEPDCHPAIRYYATPSMCTGGANTLDEARRSYRSDLAEVLGVSRHELPSAIEHLQAVVAGMWVRTKVGAVHRDRSSSRMFLQTLLSRGQSQDLLRAHLGSAAAADRAPVVVIVEPQDALGAVLDQMRPHDVLLVAYSDIQNTVGWVAIYGAQADGMGHIPSAFDGAAIRDTAVDTFITTQLTVDTRAVRVRPNPPPLDAR